MVWLSIFLGICYWVGDAIVESAVLREGPFLAQLFAPQGSCRYERPAVAALLISLGVAAEAFRQRQRRGIAELKLSENLILSAKTEWEDTFNTIDEAITVHDMNYTIVSANRAATELFSLPLQSLLGQKCCSVYHGREQPPPLCATCTVVRTGKAMAAAFFEPHLGRHLEINAMPRSTATGGFPG